jgi:hypothetical protein
MSAKGGKKGAEKVVEEVKKEVVKKVAPVSTSTEPQANIMDDLSKKQAFKKFSYRGEDITKLLSLNMDELA